MIAHDGPVRRPTANPRRGGGAHAVRLCRKTETNAAPAWLRRSHATDPAEGARRGRRHGLTTMTEGVIAGHALHRFGKAVQNLAKPPAGGLHPFNVAMPNGTRLVRTPGIHQPTRREP